MRFTPQPENLGMKVMGVLETSVHSLQILFTLICQIQLTQRTSKLVSLHVGLIMFIFGSKVVQTGCNECDLFSRTKNAKKL